MSTQIIPAAAYGCIGIIAIVISYVAISESKKEEKETSSYTSMLPNIIKTPIENVSTIIDNTVTSIVNTASGEEQPKVAAPIFQPVSGGKKNSKRHSKKIKNKNRKSGKNKSLGL